MPLTPIAVKTYKALLTQTGTAAPVATILQNTYNGTPTWTRNAEGQYLCTLEGQFNRFKTTTPPFDTGQPGGAVNLPIGNSTPADYYYNLSTLDQDDAIQLAVYDNTYTSKDLSVALAGWASKILIQIQTYQ